jgi:hypothetical protein
MRYTPVLGKKMLSFTANLSGFHIHLLQILMQNNVPNYDGWIVWYKIQGKWESKAGGGLPEIDSYGRKFHGKSRPASSCSANDYDYD